MNDLKERMWNYRVKHRLSRKPRRLLVGLSSANTIITKDAFREEWKGGEKDE